MYFTYMKKYSTHIKGLIISLCKSLFLFLSFLFLHKFQLVVVDKNCFSRNAFDYTIYDVITCTFSGRCIVTDTGDLT